MARLKNDHRFAQCDAAVCAESEHDCWNLVTSINKNKDLYRITSDASFLEFSPSRIPEE